MSGMRIECKIYVGELPRDASENELERAFRDYGRVRNVWIARNPPGFAFVEMDDPRDAEDAVRDLDGALICGVRARVELSNGRSRPKNFRDSSRERGGRRGFDPNDRCYDCGEKGHYAYNCPRRVGGRGGGGRRGRSRSRSVDRDRRGRRSPSYSDRSASRSRSPPPRRRRSRSVSSGYSR